MYGLKSLPFTYFEIREVCKKGQRERIVGCKMLFSAVNGLQAGLSN